MSEAILGRALYDQSENVLSKKTTSIASFGANTAEFNSVSSTSTTVELNGTLISDIQYTLCKMEFVSFDPVSSPTYASGSATLTSSITISLAKPSSPYSYTQTILNRSNITTPIGMNTHLLSEAFSYQTTILEGMPISQYSSFKLLINIRKSSNWTGTISWSPFTVNLTYF